MAAFLEQNPPGSISDSIHLKRFILESKVKLTSSFLINKAIEIEITRKHMRIDIQVETISPLMLPFNLQAQGDQSREVP
jgi:hypothetical protein